ncbi:right-handed parallel beta-helix repeat-containing protein [Schaalia meyeri]|uniref:right-handed parallel beta-helix repeat-containing protein n=1 Tax=Schaalia meyeri TaxID=52773 RepID=UPI002043B715|nr:right-handed parallel beta-helix repeat-containing protein [Schaalia meyeri]MCM3899530.1 right-handed parallel beta-helix repeat-containing protein [Schaalia meyeri]
MRYLNKTIGAAGALALVAGGLIAVPALAAPVTTIHVSQASGSDTNDGSAERPFATLGAALKAAPSGATVEVASGTYREGELSTSKKLTITAGKGQQVSLNGADIVTDWSDNGDGTYSSARSDFVRFSHVSTVNANPAIEGMAAYPEQVFVDGQELTQVADRSEVGPGTFWVNDPDPVTLVNPQNNRQGYHVKPHTGVSYVLGDNPAGHTVEVVQHHRSLTLGGEGSVFNGFTVEKYSPLQQWDYKDPEIGTLTGGVMFFVGAKNVSVTNNTFQYSAMGTALGLTNADGSTVSGNTITHNGGVGFGINRSSDISVEHNTWSMNNQAGFIVDNCGAFCTIGDTKITHVDGVRYAFNTHDYSEAGYNHNDPNVDSPRRLIGVWFDEGVINSEIVGNHFINVGKSAIFDEVSSGNIIASNIVENSFEGIVLSGTDSDKIFNNTIVDTLSPMVIREDTRYDGCNARNKAGECTAPEKWSGEHGLTWNATDNQIYNNVLTKSTNSKKDDPWRYSVMLRFSGGVNGDGTAVYGPEEAQGLDYNTYYRTSKDTERFTIHWEWAKDGGGSGAFNAPTLAEFTSHPQVGTDSAPGREAKGREAHGQDIIAPRTEQKLFVNLPGQENQFGASDLHPAPGSPLEKSGTTLDPEVAESLDLNANAPVNRGALVNVAWGD